MMRPRGSFTEAPLIFREKPKNWEELEEKVCQVFREAGCNAARNQTLKTVRGRVDVDVVVRDKTRRPHVLILCECKHWARPVPKTVVHAFRTVVHDSGAHLGFLISDGGFQAGSYEAAAKANIRLVTWKQFQQEMYERWFGAMETQLTLLSKKLFALADVGIEPGAHPTLASEALEAGGQSASAEFEQLRQRYAQFSLASNEVFAGIYRRFPTPGMDPRAATQKTITFKSARMYFDILLKTAPQAFADYAAFLMKYTGGRCGSYELLDDDFINRMVAGKTSANEVRHLLGYKGWIRCVPYDGEIWTFRGSLTRFSMPDVQPGAEGQIGNAMTSGRILTVDFGPDEIARGVSVENFEHPGPPRP